VYFDINLINMALRFVHVVRQDNSILTLFVRCAEQNCVIMGLTGTIKGDLQIKFEVLLRSV
jgi:hypothetical protein